MIAITTVCGAIASVLLAYVPAASSQEVPGVTGARDRLARARADADAAQARYEQAVAEREQAVVQIDELEQTISSTRTQESALRTALATRAAELYKSSDASSAITSLDTSDPMDAGRRTKFTEVASQFYQERAEQLRDRADEQQRTQADLESRRAELEGVVARLKREKADIEQKIVRASRGIEVADGVASLRAQGDPLMGPSVLSADEMAAWYRSSKASPRLSGGVSIEQLAQVFIDEGAAENVRGDVAFAQAYIETGGFRAGGSDNNFSGLGACDGCGGENRFPTALDGIRAQIQLLRNYADSGSRAPGLAHPPSLYWWGPDPDTAARAFDTFSGKGSAPTWRVMGGGKWATDPSYASKVIGTYDRMIAFAEGS